MAGRFGGDSRSGLGVLPKGTDKRKEAETRSGFGVTTTENCQGLRVGENGRGHGDGVLRSGRKENGRAALWRTRRGRNSRQGRLEWRCNVDLVEGFHVETGATRSPFGDYRGVPHVLSPERSEGRCQGRGTPKVGKDKRQGLEFGGSGDPKTHRNKGEDP